MKTTTRQETRSSWLWKFRKKLTVLFLFSLVMLLSASVVAQTVTTNKLDYVPGETAFASGTGWMANLSLTFTVHEKPVYHPDVVTTHTADVSGTFSNVAIYTFEAHDYGSSFTLTLTDDYGNSV